MLCKLQSKHLGSRNYLGIGAILPTAVSPTPILSTYYHSVSFRLLRFIHLAWHAITVTASAMDKMDEFVT